VPVEGDEGGKGGRRRREKGAGSSHGKKRHLTKEMGSESWGQGGEGGGIRRAEQERKAGVTTREEGSGDPYSSGGEIASHFVSRLETKSCTYVRNRGRGPRRLLILKRACACRHAKKARRPWAKPLARREKIGPHGSCREGRPDAHISARKIISPN